MAEGSSNFTEGSTTNTTEESAPSSFRDWAVKYNDLRKRFEETVELKNERIKGLEKELEECVRKVKSWKSEKIESLKSGKESLSDAKEMVRKLGKENDELREKNTEMKKKLRELDSVSFETPTELLQKRYEKARENELDAKRQLYATEREISYLGEGAENLPRLILAPGAPPLSIVDPIAAASAPDFGDLGPPPSYGEGIRNEPIPRNNKLCAGITKPAKNSLDSKVKVLYKMRIIPDEKFVGHRVRSDPDLGMKNTIGYLQMGDIISVIEERGDWVKFAPLETPDGRKYDVGGWTITKWESVPALEKMPNEFFEYLDCVHTLVEVDNRGYFCAITMREKLTTLGDVMSHEEVDEFFSDVEEIGGMKDAEGRSGRIHADTFARYLMEKSSK